MASFKYVSYPPCMGATNTFAPFGIFCVGGAFFSPASAVETAATTRRARILTTFLLHDICTPALDRLSTHYSSTICLICLAHASPALCLPRAELVLWTE